MEIGIKEFILGVLNELQDLRPEKSKKNYIVTNLEFEIGVILKEGKSKSGKVEVKAWVLSAAGEKGANSSKENMQKVKITLSPKSKVITQIER